MACVKEYMIKSRCSKSSPVKFHWFDGIESENSDHIEVAVDRCFAAIDNGSRVWNPYSEIMIRAEFRDTLESATKGMLEPVQQVAEVGHDPAVPMYEIRWQEKIQVTERDPDTGQLMHGKALVRMYHSEPSSHPEHFIGHHVHEKVITTDGSTSRLQTEEIEVAKRLYRLGQKVAWHVTC